MSSTPRLESRAIKIVDVEGVGWSPSGAILLFRGRYESSPVEMSELPADATTAYLYVNSEGLLNAITRQKDGANLPLADGPWTFQNEITLGAGAAASRHRSRAGPTWSTSWGLLYLADAFDRAVWHEPIDLAQRYFLLRFGRKQFLSIRRIGRRNVEVESPKIRLTDIANFVAISPLDQHQRPTF